MNKHLLLILALATLASVPVIAAEELRGLPVQLDPAEEYTFLVSCNNHQSAPREFRPDAITLEGLLDRVHRVFDENASVQRAPMQGVPLTSGGMVLIQQRRDFWLLKLRAASLREGLRKWREHRFAGERPTEQEINQRTLFEVFDYLQMGTAGNCDVLVPSRFRLIRFESMIKEAMR